MCKLGGKDRAELVLVHGLWMNRFILWPLAWRLRHRDWRLRFFSYFSTLHPYERHPERLVARLENSSANAIYLVGHSMGGVVIMSALSQLSDHARRKIAGVVTLGTPLNGSAAGLQFMHHDLGRLLMGSSRKLWQTFPILAVPAGIRVGQIAGTRRVGLGRFFAKLDGPNDGVVTVDETRLPGLTDHLVMPVSHTGMLFSKNVARQCLAFLRDGRFLS